MEFQAQIELLYRRWRLLRDQGQTLSAEAICTEEGVDNRPELVSALEKRIQLSMTVPLPQSSGMEPMPSFVPPLSDVAPQSDVVLAESNDGTSGLDDTRRRANPTMAASPTQDEQIFGVSRFAHFRFLAKGGLGEVYVAADQEFGRDVALKFIRREHDTSDDSRQMFIVESEVTARLEHPGVVPIYGLGNTADGRPFYIMRLIQGETLDDRIEQYHSQHRGHRRPRRNVAYRTLLTRFVTVCNTIAYAHSRGILHRDIKPQNIMLGKYGETLVVDWGLARPIVRDEMDRATGEQTLLPASDGEEPSYSDGVVGTPSYMSPEQAAGDKEVGKAADIYSLGATLYTLLTGKSAIRGTTVESVLENVRTGTFPPPREVNPSVPPALEAICMTAMAREPHRRYETALKLASDVERWLADEPVDVYREPRSQHMVRWMRRHRYVTQGLVGALLAAVVASTAVVTTRWNQREQLLVTRLEGLKATANVEESMLVADFRLLAQDVQFLASRPEALQVLGDADESALIEAKRRLGNTFAEFIQRRPTYMQARVIDRQGVERVRLERKEPGGEVAPAERLRSKASSTYFQETMALQKGEVYLSKLELNVEDGQKDWDFPVVRAAVPLFAEDSQPEGMLVINMHFSHLAELIQRSPRDDLLVYLTNQAGQFLLHPTPGVGFCFEEQLVYPLESIYPELATFRLSTETNTRDVELHRVRPVPSILIEPRVKDSDGRRDLENLVAKTVEQFRNVNFYYSEAQDRVILKGLEAEQLDEIASYVESDLPGRFHCRPLPPRFVKVDQAVYCRKIFFDPRRPDRFLNLVLVVPNTL